MFDDPNVSALMVMGAAGAVVGLVGGVLAGARRLFGTVLMGIIGAIAVAAIARAGGAPTIYGIGSFSFVWGALGGFLLAYVVGRTDRP